MDSLCNADAYKSKLLNFDELRIPNNREWCTAQWPIYWQETGKGTSLSRFQVHYWARWQNSLPSYKATSYTLPSASQNNAKRNVNLFYRLP